MTAPITIALNALKSDRCACLRKKRVRDALCNGCYFTLPKAMQQSLHVGISQGFVENYALAVKWLRENTERFLNAPKED
jgi:hypothetical protein